MLEFVERTSQEIFRKLGDVEGNQGKKCREEVDRREKEGCNEIQRMEWRRGVDTREKTAKMKQSSNTVQSTGACMKQCEEH